MKMSLREALGYKLEKLKFLDRWLLRYDGVGPGGLRRYINRVNGHVVMKAHIFVSGECFWGGPENAGCYHPGACGCRVPGMFEGG